MFRGIVAGVAVLFASAPASAVVVFQSSGVLPAGDWANLFFWGQPTLDPGRLPPQYSLDSLDGHYRMTFVSEELSSYDLKSCSGCSFFMGAELQNRWTEWRNGKFYTANEGLAIYEATYKPFSDMQEVEFDYRYFVDSTDENGTGYWDFYSGIFNLDLVIRDLDRPISYTYTIERFTLPPVPEPATWAMMIAGLGMAGAAMRRRRASVIPA